MGGSSMGADGLVASAITKRYGRETVLREVSLRVGCGEVVALTGENGVGKSTLLRVCAGMTPADEGSVTASGRVGYCPQIPGLLDRLSADDHLVLFGRAAGIDRAAALDRGRAILEEFGFPVASTTMVRDLSGGTRQKLNLALALLAEPDVLLLDEPYQGFDRGTYVNFWDHCRAWRDAGKAVLVVTHMLAELERVDRVVELAPGRLATEDRFP